MKTRNVSNWWLGLALAFLPIANGCSPGPASAANGAVDATAVTEQDSSTAPGQMTNADAALPEQSPELGNDPAKAVEMERTLPPNIRSRGPAAEVLKLANSGIDESVMLAFITNSARTFDLDSDEIIYFHDLGLPSAVVTAMMQRDQVLNNAIANRTAPDIMPNSAPGFFASQPDTVPSVSDAQPPVDSADVAAPSPVIGNNADFYDALAPYGNWVEVDGHGACWQPAVEQANRDWQPYLDGGHWVYTDSGWYWSSDYQWGWAPFHYGRWFQDTGLGWCWSPDTAWAPAWVCWRQTDDYCGWAPLPPGAWFRQGVGLTFYGRPVAVGFSFGLGMSSFAFVDIAHFRDHHLHQHTLAHQQVSGIFHATVATAGVTSSHNHVINHGISPQVVATATHTPVHTVAVQSLVSGKPDAQGSAFASGRPGEPERNHTTAPRTTLARSAASQLPQTSANSEFIPHENEPRALVERRQQTFQGQPANSWASPERHISQPSAFAPHPPLAREELTERNFQMPSHPEPPHYSPPPEPHQHSEAPPVFEPPPSHSAPAPPPPAPAPSQTHSHSDKNGR